METISEKKSEAQVIPFMFKGLKKISRRQIELEEGVLNYLPFSHENSVKKNLEDFLSTQFNLPCRLTLEKIEEVGLAEFIQTLPPLSLMGVLGVQPLPSKALLWIDSSLAHSFIDRVLGGEGTLPLEIKSLTAIEEGVLQYLLLKTLHQAQQALGPSAPMHFRFENVLKSQKELTALSLKEEPMVQLHFRLEAGGMGGYLVLALPHPLVQGIFMKQSQPDIDKNHEYALKRFDALAHTKTPLWAEIGSVSLTIAEKNQLEKGDVVLFDQSHSQMIDHHLAGNAILRVGEGKSGGFLAQVVSGEAPVLLKILDYYEGE